MSRWLRVWGPAVALMLGIFLASSVPNLDTVATGVSDKSLHFVAYGALGVLLLRALAGARWAGVTPAAAAGAWVLAVLWGVTDELHQAFVPGRTAALDDWLADAGGAIAGVGVVVAFALGRRGRERREV
jgi:VanZ family protein